MNIQNSAANANNLEADEQLVIHAGAQQHVELGFDGMVFVPGRAKRAHGRREMPMSAGAQSFDVRAGSTATVASKEPGSMTLFTGARMVRRPLTGETMS
jgi:hypothetical protein